MSQTEKITNLIAGCLVEPEGLNLKPKLILFNSS